MTIADSTLLAKQRQAQIVQALDEVNQRIATACSAAQRSTDSVRLLAVSKTKPESDIRAAYAAGQRDFGENYVQEGIQKIAALQDLDDICWHFIGPLQSNKSKDVAQHFDWMHSLDRLKVARRLNQQRTELQAPLQVLIQVNIDEEAAKAGIALSEIDAFAAALAEFPRLQLRGLMAIPQADASEAAQARSYHSLQQALSKLQANHPEVDTLSLGMSNDLDAAIQHGTTMVRIGTSIFGKRQV